MTKRFTTKNGVFYTDNLTGWEFQSYGEVVKLMNELADEIEQLKQSISDWRGSYDELYEDVTRLEKENEQLKKEKEYFLKVIFAMGNYAELDDYENIINARDAVKRRLLNG